MAFTKRTGLFFIVLFLLPFCGVGLSCVVLALQEAASEQPEVGTVLFLGLFGLVCGGVGVWMILRAFRVTSLLSRSMNERSSTRINPGCGIRTGQAG